MSSATQSKQADVIQTAIVSVWKATGELDAMTAIPDMKGMPQDYAKVCALQKTTQYLCSLSPKI